MNHGSLFSGIGGFDLAAEWIGWQNIFQCEIDEYCRQVLKKNFPETKQYADIKEFNKKHAEKYNGKIDIISGGFPCQPFSIAGKKKGREDNRYLWKEMYESIQHIQPEWAVIENVPGLLTIENGLVFELCCIDLENEGYEVQTLIIPALAVNACHRRDRIWIIAYNHQFHRGRTQRQKQVLSDSKRNLEGKETARKGQPSIRIKRNDKTNSDIEGEGFNWSCRATEKQPGCPGLDERNWVEIATELCGSDNGLSVELDGFKLSKARHKNERIKAMGNAIVPQVAYNIFAAIEFQKRNL